MGLQSEIKSAIGAHGMWKARLSRAIETANCELTVSVVRQDGACAFGKWLDSSNLEPAVRDSEHYVRCKEIHRQFHEAAADVLALALAGQKQAALDAMKPDSKFAHVSAGLTIAMMNWSRALT